MLGSPTLFAGKRGDPFFIPYQGEITEMELTN